MSGRAVPDVVPIRCEDIPETLVFINQLTNIPIEQLHLLGSAGKVPRSGDLDIAVCDLLYTADDTNAYLTSVYGKERCVHNKGTGVYSYPVEIGGDLAKGCVQLDLMFVSNPEWAEFAYFSNPTKSKYKGAVRTMLLMGVAATINQPDIDYFEYDEDGQLMVRAGWTFDLNVGVRRIFQYRKKKKRGKGYLKSLTTVTRPEFEELFPTLRLEHQPTIDWPDMALEMMFGTPDFDLQPEDVETAEQVLDLITDIFDEERQQAIYEKAATRVTKGKFDLPPEIEAYVK